MPKQLSLIKRIEKNTGDAIAALVRENYATYIRLLDELGQGLFDLYQAHSPNASPRSNKTDKNRAIAWLNQQLPPFAHDLSDPLPYCTFEEVWIDEYLRSPLEIDDQPTYRRYLSPKTHLNRSTRQNINLGMWLIARSIQYKARALDKKNMALRDEKAYEAIKTYQTKKHRALTIAGKILAAIVSLVFSITVAGTVALFLSAWPIALSALIASIVLSASFIFYWLGTRKLAPRMLIDVFGKDRFLEGWTHYYDEETGKKKELSRKGKLALGLAAILSLLLSFATGVLTYSLIAHLGQLSLFAFLAAGTTAAAALPPIGLTIAIVVAIGSFIYFMQPLVNMLHSKNIWNALKKPFRDAMWVFDPQNKNNAGKTLARINFEKTIAFGVLGLVGVFTIAGAIILQIQYARSLALWMQTSWAISSTIALGIADALCMMATLVGQLPYTMRTITGGVLYGMSKTGLRAKPENHANQTPALLSKSKKEKSTPNFASTALKEDAKEERLHRLTQLPPKPSPNLPPEKNTKPPRARHYYRFFRQTPIIDQQRPHDVKKCAVRTPAIITRS